MCCILKILPNYVKADNAEGEYAFSVTAPNEAYNPPSYAAGSQPLGGPGFVPFSGSGQRLGGSSAPQQAGNSGCLLYTSDAADE